MSLRARYLVLLMGVAGVAVLFVAAVYGLPSFGGSYHPYRDRAVAAALGRHTANVVSAVNFDQRGLDTLGEEVILLASVLAASVLLRAADDERERAPVTSEVLPATGLMGYLLLPVTLLVGASVIVHGAVTPGGGFQGGVVAAAGLHLLYIAGSYRMLQRVRPQAWAVPTEGVGATAFVVVGAAGFAEGTAFLANVLPTGQLGDLASGGTVALLNVAVGVAVFGGVVVLLAHFLRQEELLTRDRR
jgi:multicomponent Na+:H+ antiporter subunit B